MAATPPVVRIKRKRDEPPLAGFVLGSKRPNLASLSLDVPAAAAAQGTRYRLVSRGALCQPGAPDAFQTPTRDAAALAAAREQGVRQQQAAARFRRVVRMRSADDVFGGGAAAATGVLELQRCGAASHPEKPKLRPFGPPLPPRTAAPPPRVAAEGRVDEADLWADAAAAAELVAAEEEDAAAAVAAAERDEQFVYDEYEPTAAGEDAPDVELFTPQIWWEDLDGEGFVDEDAALYDGEGSDSQGEVDYPEEEEGDESADSDDGDRRYLG